MHAHQIVLAPIVSEKSYHGSVYGKYTFRVHEDAHKTQIRQAIEELFEVHVVRVNVLQGPAQAQAARDDQGHEAGLEEGRRPAEARRDHRGLPGSAAVMPVRRFKPTSPGRRFMTVSDFAEVTKSKPEKALTEKLTKKGGRNDNGRITTRHQGGGHKRRYRVIDFKRTKDGIPAKVAAIEYDPNRSARIALLHYADGFKSYILAPAGLRVGAEVQSGPGSDIKPGNALPLENDPDRHARAQRRAQARQGRSDGPVRRLRHPARRQGPGLRDAAAPLG